MASRTRPFLMTGAALASAAAIVTASPALLPTHDIAVGAPTPLPLSTAKVALTAISDITIQGINDAYWFGWGGYIQPDNTYYPGITNPIYISGASGALYYLVDNAAESFVPGFDLDNYYFEIGAQAVPYVAAGELFGTSSPIFQAAQATFYYGIPNVINSVVVSAAGLIPETSIGPVKVGGGILASLYFYGYTPDGTSCSTASFCANTNGLSAILAYISTSISDSLPSAAAVASSLSAAASSVTATVESAVKNLENAVQAATTTTTASSAAAKSSKTVAPAEVKAASEGTTPSTDGSSTEGTTSSTDGTTSTTTKSTDDTTPSTTKSTDDTTSTTTKSTDGGTSTTTKSTGGAAPTTPKKATTTKPENPLAKIGQKISDALSPKKPKSESSSSGDSSSSSSSSSSGGGAS